MIKSIATFLVSVAILGSLSLGNVFPGINTEIIMGTEQAFKDDFDYYCDQFEVDDRSGKYKEDLPEDETDLYTILFYTFLYSRVEYPDGLTARQQAIVEEAILNGSATASSVLATSLGIPEEPEQSLEAAEFARLVFLHEKQGGLHDEDYARLVDLGKLLYGCDMYMDIVLSKKLLPTVDRSNIAHLLESSLYSEELDRTSLSTEAKRLLSELLRSSSSSDVIYGCLGVSVEHLDKIARHSEQLYQHATQNELLQFIDARKYELGIALEVDKLFMRVRRAHPYAEGIQLKWLFIDEYELEYYYAEPPSDMLRDLLNREIISTADWDGEDMTYMLEARTYNILKKLKSIRNNDSQVTLTLEDLLLVDIHHPQLYDRLKSTNMDDILKVVRDHSFSNSFIGLLKDANESFYNEVYPHDNEILNEFLQSKQIKFGIKSDGKRLRNYVVYLSQSKLQGTPYISEIPDDWYNNLWMNTRELYEVVHKARHAYLRDAIDEVYFTE